MLGNHQRVGSVGTIVIVRGSRGGSTASRPHHCPSPGRSSPSGPSPLRSIVPTSFQELPDPEKVSTEVQQMWVLTEVIRARQAAARIGRFDVSPAALLAGAPASPHCWGALSEGLLLEGWGGGLGWAVPAERWCCAETDTCSLFQVDGCYDINLLSYT